MFLYALALFIVLQGWSNAVADFGPATYFREVINGKYELGSLMAMRAYDVICWYEYMKLFPPAQVPRWHEYMYGDGNAHVLCAEMKDKFQLMWDTYDRDSMQTILAFEQYRHEFNDFYRDLARFYRITSYDEPNATMLKEYSNILEDGGKDFEFKFDIHSWLQFLITRNGGNAIKAIREEKQSKQLPVSSWRELMLERENQFRKLHDAEPLELDENLNAAAQEYATYLEKENNCEPVSCRTKGKCTYKGKEFGENICIGEYDVPDLAGMPYICPAQYYTQKHHYQHRRSIHRSETNSTKESEQGKYYEQFAQMLWKPTKKVGYGYVAENGEGPCKGFIVVSKYFPLGGQKERFTSEEFQRNLNELKNE